MTGMVQRYTMGPFDHTTVVRTRDVVGIVRGVRRAVFGTGAIKATDLTNTLHGPSVVGRADLLHLFNTLSIGTTPYIVTFEQYLPRWNQRSRFGLRLMLRPQCHRMIAMSHFAQRFQQALCAEAGPPAATLREKMTVLHPGQPLLIDSYDQKPLEEGGVIRCLFVGREFFRKGGREVLLIFERLIAEGLPLHLTIVSALETGDYASQATEKDRAWAEGRLTHDLPNGIEFHRELPNDEVLRLMIRSHLTLLPTYDYTFGFSVLESQAAGCPVITTDVCALPEINDASSGWVVEVEKNAEGIAVRESRAERDRLSAQIRSQLELTLRAICRSPEQIRTKGKQALERIARRHDPAVVARAIESIYDEALDSQGKMRSLTPEGSHS